MTLALAAAATPAQACDICAIYTGSLMREDKTGFILGASEQFTDYGSIREDDKSVPNPDNEWMTSSITQLVVGYQLTRNFGVQANVPLIAREYRRLENGVPTRGDVGGLGDISLIGRYAPVSRAVGSVLVHVEMFGGLKVPTGDSDRLSEELAHGDDGHGDGHDDGHGDGHDDGHGDGHEHDHGGAALAAPFPSDRTPRHEEHEHASTIHGHDIALGTGSVDGVFGLTLYADWKRLFGRALVQYVVRGNGDFSYEYANDLTWEVSPGFYMVASHNWTAALRFVISGENKGRDHHQGMLVDNALTNLYLGPGFMMTWSDAFYGDFALDLPVVQDTTGRQLVADYRLRLGVGWRF
ncbi:MAG: hypothetical protein ABR587_07630 [Candidatus Binatia bacterium]